MGNYTKYKLLIILIKYTPIVGAGFMLSHVAQLLLGYDPVFAHYTFGFSIVGTILLLLASKVLQFCKMHRAFIMYDFIMENCINYEQYYGFESILTKARYVMLLFGFILFIWFIYAELQGHCCRYSRKFCC